MQFASIDNQHSWVLLSALGDNRFRNFTAALGLADCFEVDPGLFGVILVEYFVYADHA
jgi:hypothetical protein